MKGIIAAVLMTCLFSVFSVNAQQGNRQNRTPEERIKSQVERLEKDLKLTAEQKEKVTALYQKNEKDRAASRENRDQQTQEDRRRAMEARMKKTNAEMKKILTEDQYKKYEQQQKERRERQGNRNRQNN